MKYLLIVIVVITLVMLSVTNYKLQITQHKKRE